MKTTSAKWLKALIASIVTGSSSSGLSALGVTVADAAGANIGSLNFKQMGVMSLAGGLVGMLAYLKQSPVPPDDTLS